MRNFAHANKRVGDDEAHNHFLTNQEQWCGRASTSSLKYITQALGCAGQIGILINFSHFTEIASFPMACRDCAFNAAWKYRITEGPWALKSYFYSELSSSFAGTATFLPFYDALI